MLLDIYSLAHYNQPSSPAHDRAFGHLTNLGLIENGYNVTEKGRAFIKKLCNTPLLIMIWNYPEET